MEIILFKGRIYSQKEKNRIVSGLFGNALIFTVGRNRLFFFNGEKSKDYEVLTYLRQFIEI